MAHHDQPRRPEPAQRSSQSSVQTKRPELSSVQTNSLPLPPPKTLPPAVVSRNDDGSEKAPLPFTGFNSPATAAAFLPHLYNPTPDTPPQMRSDSAGAAANPVQRQQADDTGPHLACFEDELASEAVDGALSEAAAATPTTSTSQAEPTATPQAEPVTPAAQAEPTDEESPWLDWVQGGLDATSIALDATGIGGAVSWVPDVVNGGISAARGDWTGAGLSMAAAIPFFGAAANSTRIARTVAKSGDEIAAGVKTAKRAGKQNTPRSTLPRDKKGSYLPDEDAMGAHTVLGARKGKMANPTRRGRPLTKTGTLWDVRMSRITAEAII